MKDLKLATVQEAFPYEKGVEHVTNTTLLVNKKTYFMCCANGGDFKYHLKTSGSLSVLEFSLRS